MSIRAVLDNVVAQAPTLAWQERFGCYQRYLLGNPDLMLSPRLLLDWTDEEVRRFRCAAVIGGRVQEAKYIRHAVNKDFRRGVFIIDCEFQIEQPNFGRFTLIVVKDRDGKTRLRQKMDILINDNDQHLMLKANMCLNFGDGKQGRPIRRRMV